MAARAGSVWRSAGHLWAAFWKAVADAFDAIGETLGVAFRLHPDVAKPVEGRIGSYAVTIAGWVEFLGFKLMLAVMLLTIGNANATVRELIESVRP